MYFLYSNGSDASVNHYFICDIINNHNIVFTLLVVMIDCKWYEYITIALLTSITCYILIYRIVGDECIYYIVTSNNTYTFYFHVMVLKCIFTSYCSWLYYVRSTAHYGIHLQCDISDKALEIRALQSPKYETWCVVDCTVNSTSRYIFTVRY
jgi:hypothetical protein